MNNIKDFIDAQNKHISKGEIDNELSKPIPLDENGRKPMRFPVESLGQELFDFTMKVEELTQAPITMCAQSVLAAVGLAVQPYANVHVGSRRFPCSTFFLTIGVSGERKSSVDRIVSEPIREYERKLDDRHDIELKQYEAEKERYTCANKKDKQFMVNPTKPLDAIMLVQEPTYEGLIRLYETGQPSMGLFSDEGGRFISGHGMNTDNKIKTLAGLCELWDGNPISRVRAGEGAKKLWGRRLSFHLMMQPHIANSVLSDSAIIDQGFLWRCLIAYPESNIGNREYKDENIFITSEYQAYYKRMANILHTPLPLYPNKQNELNCPTLILDDRAKELMIDFYKEVEGQQVEKGLYKEISGFASKAVEHASRLAAVLSLYENINSKIIDHYKMWDGIKIVKFYLYEMNRLFNDKVDIFKMSDKEQKTLAKKLLNWIGTYLAAKKSSIITMREMIRLGPYKLRNKEILLKLLEILQDYEWIESTGSTSSWKVRVEYINQ